LLGPTFGFILTFTLTPLLNSFNYQFSLQGFAVSNILAILGIISIIGLTVIGVLTIQRFRNKSGGSTLYVNSPETYLDSLIYNIEFFIQKWKNNGFRKPSYRHKIETKSTGNWRLKLRKQANEIGRQSKFLKGSARQVISVMNDELFKSIDKNVDDLVSLGFDLESTFDSRKNLTKAESNLDHFISQGDTICQNFSSIVPQLEKIRKDL
jgi:hypothetical protein